VSINPHHYYEPVKFRSPQFQAESQKKSFIARHFTQLLSIFAQQKMSHNQPCYFQICRNGRTIITDSVARPCKQCPPCLSGKFCRLCGCWLFASAPDSILPRSSKALCDVCRITKARLITSRQHLHLLSLVRQNDKHISYLQAL
jgi:hypothetical protein